MARIDKGNDLSSPVLQAGWTVGQDGYGLWTGKCTFKLDRDYAVAIAEFDRGVAHPVAPFDAFMWSNRCSASYDRNGIATLTIDYVGINTGTAPGEGEPTVTAPNVSGAVATSSEPIETHRNFFTNTDSINAIAGYGTGTVTAPIYEASTFKVDASGTLLYAGDHGAHFTQVTGGKFVGFLDPEFPYYYGRKSYLSPTTGFSGVIYVKGGDANPEGDTLVQTMRSAVGFSSTDQTFQGFLPVLVPNYMGTVYDGEAGGQLLLASVNFEDYGLNIYKISYTLRYSVEGWVPEVYPLLGT